ncbi:MAG: hypothetical protein WD669_12565 [Pirellulales bacterium]
MPIESAALFRRYRAPQEDGQVLVDPPASELPEVVARNRQRLGGLCYDLNGRCLSELSAEARRRLIVQSLSYTRQYREVPASIAGSQLPPIILSGHQPQMFHPGVWYKNFVLGSLARQVRGIGIHFLIDSDLCRSVSIRVPSGTPHEPRVETIAYDLPAGEIPYEERAIRDRATFESFADRVATTIQPLVKDPLVKTLWPLAIQQSRRHSNLGLSLAQGRHLVEADMQNDSLELPQSAVCQMPEFSWFIAHLLAHLPTFRDAYNGALAAYRRAHRTRNRAQPVPDLAKAGDWLEAPLWMWSSDDPLRRPLFARQRAGQVEISDRSRRTIQLDLSADGDAAAATNQLLELAAEGIKIRTRALATTLFARLVLGDLFLHGIGGAKYDQVTNLMAREFYGFDLPEFATVSATLRLPIDRPHDRAAFPSTRQSQLRELRFHPERFVANDISLSEDDKSKVAEIIAAKQRWIGTAKTPQNARERHSAINAANNALQPYVDRRRRRLEQQHAEHEDERRAAAILDSREYSYCLYPRSRFERLLLDGAMLGA